MVNTSKKNPPHFGCFSNIFEKFICKSNLPTHPCLSDEIPEKIIQTKSDAANNKIDTEVVVRSQVQTQASPGIVARLMGLETMPDCENTRKSTSSHETLFRSKSLSSLHFLPDFDPARAAFHRRARTSSASFHEQGPTLLVKIDEISEIADGVKKTELFKSGRDEFKQKKPEKRENVVNLKGNECRKSRKNIVGKNKPNNQERYQKSNKFISNRLKASTNVVSNERNYSRGKCGIQRNKSLNKDQNMKVVSNISRKKKVDHKKGMDVDVQSDVSTRSPVSVLDHHLEFDSPSTDDANVILISSPSRRKSARKIKLLDEPTPQYMNLKSNKNDDNSPDKRAREQKSVKNDAELAEYFMGLSGQVCELADAQLSKDMTSDIRRYELFKAQLLDDLCLDLGQEIVGYLLNELTDELTSFKF
ncbi:uncharacterized protein LOC141587090 [Silene latifolia]|uniref:uncharacterized protein LOC141587090 n=1 Tax=Silene latifolia TaxID=37657 RepID=UPI003D76EB94